MSSRVLTRFFMHLVLSVCLICAGGVQAQEFGALARAIPQASKIEDRWRGRAALSLGLSAGVPWRMFTLRNPDRVVIDFREVDFRGLDLEAFDQSDAVTEIAAGPLRAGWSRMVLVLAAPMRIDEAALDTTPGAASLNMRLVPEDRASFDASAGVPKDPAWDIHGPLVIGQPAALPTVFTVVLDPGHGGIDPGAVRQGFREADLVLQIALQLEEILIRSGNVRVVLTRRADDFVALERRIAIASQAGAHAFVSLHADAVPSGIAQGASVFTLSDTAEDEAAMALVERHERGDLLAGVDLSGSDDEIAQVLIDLARQDSAQRSEMLAQAIVGGITQNDVKMHKRPLQQAGFSVLKSADIPSVLVEAGFLSTDAELERLRDPDWQRQIATGIRDGLLAWALADRTVAPLRRK